MTGQTVTVNSKLPQWEGVTGVVEDSIVTGKILWWNVRVINPHTGESLRLALKPDEFN